MRIALIRREFMTHLDGVNRFIANIAEGFKVLGHDVVIVSWSYRGVKADNLSKWFKEVHGLDYEFEVYTLKDAEEHDKWVTMMYDWFTKGGKLLERLGLDIALVNGVIPLRFKPKIALVHGPLLNIFRIERAALRVLYKMYDYTVCVSRESEKEYRGVTKCDIIIPLPLKLKNFMSIPSSERENLIVHIGTRSVKNPWISIKAVEILRERGHDVSLVIVGSRSVRIEELCKNKRFVTSMFDISENEKNEVLCRAKALVLPSSRETFSYVSLEAMACGIPLVASYAVPEDVVIHGYNGLRVNSLDPLDYANAFESMLRDDGLWLNLSERALKYVKGFDHVEIARNYSGLLERFVGT